MPKNKEDNDKVRDERKEQILYHALRLFVRKGLTATRMTDIASSAGVSQGLAYHYYSSKEAIFVELIKNAYGRMTEAALGLEKLELSPQEKITMAAEQLMKGFAEGETAALNFLLIIQASVYEAIPVEAKKITAGRSVLHEVIAKIIIAGQRDGTFKPHDPRDMALLFWSSLAGLAITKATFREEFRAPDAKILVGMLIQNPIKQEGLL